jgi:hypothetical protein
MNDMEFRAFLDLMMCSDPWPVAIDSEPFDTHQQMIDVANRLALDRGYSDWIDAYHSHAIGLFVAMGIGDNPKVPSCGA